MITLIIITAYILSVFLARWINKINYKLWREVVEIRSSVWFIPIVNILVEFIDLYDTKERLRALGKLPAKKGNLFTGKNW